jgi:peptidoglycan/xylan/chitin deacetylase (PgdA/CDA1 family)
MSKSLRDAWSDKHVAKASGLCNGIKGLRRLLHHCIAIGFYYCGFYRLWLRWHRSRGFVCVLGLHRVLESGVVTVSHPAILLQKNTFASLLQFLEKDFAFVRLLDWLDQTTALTARAECIVTFDDGWADNYLMAWPMLRERRIPATIFLSTDYIDTNKMFWVERFRASRSEDPEVDNLIESYKRMPAAERELALQGKLTQTSELPSTDAMLTWSQVREMCKDGIEFGSHTHTHPLLSHEDQTTAEQEIVIPRDVLREQAGIRVRTFAYPNGDWNHAVRSAVERNGYECAFTTRSRWYRRGEDRFAIPRILLHEGNVTGFTGKFSESVLSLTLAGWT